jgi:hypothetical protein
MFFAQCSMRNGLAKAATLVIEMGAIHETTRNYSNKNLFRAASCDFVDRFWLSAVRLSRINN